MLLHDGWVPRKQTLRWKFTRKNFLGAIALRNSLCEGVEGNSTGSRERLNCCVLTGGLADLTRSSGVGIVLHLSPPTEARGPVLYSPELTVIGYEMLPGKGTWPWMRQLLSAASSSLGRLRWALWADRLQAAAVLKGNWEDSSQHPLYFTKSALASWLWSLFYAWEPGTQGE